MKKRKILFLPADSLPLFTTRSHYLANEIGKYHFVYLLRWSDPRTKGWIKGKYSKLDSFFSFIKSLCSPVKIYKNSQFKFKIIYSPVMSNAFIGKLLGRLRARKIARKFNKRVIKFLVKKFSIDTIFYADGFYYFPFIEKRGVKIFGDIQDDFDEPNEDIMKEEIKYSSKCFSKCKKIYVVTPFIAERFSSIYNLDFEWLPNGVDFEKYKNTPQKRIDKIKKSMNLENKYIISYIGSSSLLDWKFVQLLSYTLYEELPDAILLIIGSKSPFKSLKNIININFISPQDVHLYFLISDVGIFCPPNFNSKFIFHSLPLKIIHYSAAKKFVISFPIKWLEENLFPNIRILPPDAEKWVIELKNLKSQKWQKDWDKIWERYDWKNIVKAVLKEI